METNCGPKVSDGKIKDSSSRCLSVSLQISVGQAHCWVSEPSRRKKSHSLSTRVGGKYGCVRLYMRYCVCGFWIGTAVWFFDSNDVGPSQIDRRRRREWEQEWETRQEENESNRDREKRKKSNSEAIVDNSRFFSPSGCLFLSSISIHHRLSIQGHWLMSFNMAGQPGSLSLRKWG